MIGPFADVLNPNKTEVHVTELIISGDGKLLNRRDRADRVPVYLRQASTRYDPLNNSRASHVHYKLASFRDMPRPARPTLLTQAKSLLGKFFSRLTGRNGGTPEEVEAEDTLLETTDKQLDEIKMPRVEIYDKSAE